MTTVPQDQSNIQDIPELTEKDKKADILAAFGDLKKKYEQRAEAAKEKKDISERTKEKRVMEEAAGYSADQIISDCAALERGVHTALSNIGSEMQEHMRKLQSVKEAIEIGKRELQEIHDITAKADTLSELMEMHRIKKQEFEEEMAQTRAQWSREQEQRRYDLESRRIRELDALENEKSRLERKIAELKQELSSEEGEIARLRKRTENFEAELGKTIEETEKRARAEEKSKADLLAEKTQRDKALLEQQVASLAARLAEAQNEISGLRTQLNEVNREAKQIAIKVIEGISKADTLENIRNIAMEQARAGKES